MEDTAALSEKTGASKQRIARPHAFSFPSGAESIGRHHFNSHLPIASLPFEVVCIIFQSCLRHCDLSSSFGFSQPSLRPQPHAWLVVTQFYHRWREFALDYPALWTKIYICCHTVRLATIFVKRSQSLPLHIWSLCNCNTRNGTFDHAKVLSFVTENMLRIETLALSLPNRAYANGMVRSSQALELHGPALRSVECIASDDFNDQCSIVPKFFTAIIPSTLTRLRIKGHDIRTPELVLPSSLTHLSLEGSYRGDMMSIGPPDLVKMIRHLTALESLRLVGFLQTWLQPHTLPVVANTPATSFPRLVNVEMSGTAVATIVFLDHLDLPASAHVAVKFLEFDFAHIAPALVPAVHSKLSQVIPGADDTLQPIQHVQITASAFLFYKRLPLGSITPAMRAHPPGFAIQWGTRIWDMTFVNAILMGLCPELPIGDVIHLTIDCDPDKFAVATLLHKVEKTVEVLSFGDAMRKHQPAMTHHHVLDILRELELPRLRHLVLEGLRFSASGDGHGRRFKYAVYDLLKKRDVERGLEALEEITILRCSAVTQKTVDLWEDLVGYVEWDGYGDDLMESDEETSTDSAETDSEDEGETESQTGDENDEEDEMDSEDEEED
ncbi:hypothetical protein EIP91_009344 [Steccherinum ochraceum]|uniref:F-box domain-containing protein n=1 Tax=Steccherinum ochraceum TaxID=92696 RepID=A0A4R0RZY4_9APHY|nr:hypothetical protein EIP91_009344 [Steccherinum ochraceum]